MSIPNFQALMLPVLKALSGQGATANADIRECVRSSEGLKESDCRQMLPSGRQRVFDNRIHWALTHLTKAGLVDRPRRGHYKLTDNGKRVLAEEPTRIDIAILRRFRTYEEWRSTFTSSSSEDPADDEDTDGGTPLEVIERAARRLQRLLEADVLESVLKCPPAFLEKVVIDLLVAMGYGGGNATMAYVTGGSGDGGIDGKVQEDALGLDEIYVQAKQYDPSKSVGEPALRDFVGALDGCGIHKGVFVTTSDFNRGARDYVDKVQKRIILIDGKELARLMVLHGVGVRRQTVYEIKQIDKDYYDSE